MVQAVSSASQKYTAPPPTTQTSNPTATPNASAQTASANGKPPPSQQTAQDIQTIQKDVNQWNGVGQSPYVTPDYQGIQNSVYNTLNTAASQGRINDVLNGLAAAHVNLNSVEQILDYGGTGVSGAGLSQQQRDTLFTNMAQHGASPQNLVNLANSFTYGADVAGVLKGAASSGQINKVLNDRNLNLTSIAQKLDGSGNLQTFGIGGNVPALSQTDRNNLFNSIVQGSFVQGGASPANIAKLGDALTTGADVAGLLNAASNSAEIDQVLNNMTDGQLSTVAQKLGDGSISPGDRSALYGNMVAGLASGQQLARLTQQLAQNGNYTYSDVYAMGAAVARSTNAGMQLDYFNAMKGFITNPTPVLGGYATVGMLTAGALAPVLANMSGSTFTQAVQGLSNSQLQAIMQAPSMGTGSTRSEDLTQLDNIINAAATSSDPVVKARVFLQGAQILSAINAPPIPQLPSYKVDPTNGQIPQLASALTNLLQHDTIGQMNVLSADMSNGPALTAYVQEMLKEGRGGDIAGLMAPLMSGNNPKMSPADWLNQQNNGNYTNANSLAFLVGATEAAMYRTGADAKTTADTVVNMLGTAASIASAFASGGSAVVVKAGLAGASGLVKFDESAIIDALKGGQSGNLPQKLLDYALPKDKNGLTVQNGGTQEFINRTIAVFEADAGILPSA